MQGIVTDNLFTLFLVLYLPGIDDIQYMDYSDMDAIASPIALSPRALRPIVLEISSYASCVLGFQDVRVVSQSWGIRGPTTPYL